ncbi:MAG TPA: thiol reductase thioredoxin [Lachnospiraceae bacterium]|nr:thiol reductase thioredoxin [Lachnospiraceae bacterium]
MEIRKITGDNFQTEVTEADRPVLLEFYADWCTPCKAQLPVLMQAAEEACDVKFCKINIDEDPQLAERFGVTHVPTMLVMNKEKVFRTIRGFHPLEEILTYLEM